MQLISVSDGVECEGSRDSRECKETGCTQAPATAHRHQTSSPAPAKHHHHFPKLTRADLTAEPCRLFYSNQVSSSALRNTIPNSERALQSVHDRLVQQTPPCQPPPAPMPPIVPLLQGTKLAQPIRQAPLPDPANKKKPPETSVLAQRAPVACDQNPSSLVPAQPASLHNPVIL